MINYFVLSAVISGNRAGLSIPEALGKLSIGGPLLTYVEDQRKNNICSFTNSCIRVTALLEYLDLQSRW